MSSSCARSCAVVHNLGGRRAKKRKKTQVHPDFFSNSSSLTCSFWNLWRNPLPKQHDTNRKLIEQVPWWRKGTKFVQIQRFLIFFDSWIPTSLKYFTKVHVVGTHPHLGFFSITWWSSSSWRLEHQTLSFQKKMPSQSPVKQVVFLFTGAPAKFSKNFWAPLNS